MPAPLSTSTPPDDGQTFSTQSTDLNSASSTLPTFPNDQVATDQTAPVATTTQPDPVLSAAFSTVVDQMKDPLNPNNPSGAAAKEAPLLAVTLEHPAVDQIASTPYIELEKNHELPPEVEGYLKQLENHQNQLPQEVVIADSQTGQMSPRVLAQPVVILPLTEEQEKKGKSKNPKFSVRWLVEYSWKMMKVFSGKVMYRTADSSAG